MQECLGLLVGSHVGSQKDALVLVMHTAKRFPFVGHILAALHVVSERPHLDAEILLRQSQYPPPLCLSICSTTRHGLLMRLHGSGSFIGTGWPVGQVMRWP